MVVGLTIFSSWDKRRSGRSGELHFVEGLLLDLCTRRNQAGEEQSMANLHWGKIGDMAETYQR
jgi:hypothetical protein